MTRYATVQEQDRACAAILVDRLRGYVKCEGRRWYVWDEQAWKWERATVAYGVSRRIVREVRELIVQAVMEDRYEDARDWCRSSTRRTSAYGSPRTCRASTGRTKRYSASGGRPG